MLIAPVVVTACAVIAVVLLGPIASTRSTDSPGPPAPPPASFFVSPNGNDGGSCSQSAPCASWNAAYQRAQPGQVIEIAGGSYPSQAIESRPSTRNLHPGCTTANTHNCIVLRPAADQTVILTGPLRVNGSSVWIQGSSTPSVSIPQRGRSYSIKIAGSVDTEATTAADFPDHVILQGISASSFGVFGVHTAVFRDLDIGPATAANGCSILQGDGFENKIGYAGGIDVVPTNVTLDHLIIHNQNRNAAGAASDCHFGGLFLVTARGLTIENSVFSQNAVYNIQVQNFGGAPPASRVTIQNDWFGCPVGWLYDPNGETTCDNQADIQVNSAAPFSDWLIRYNSFGGGIGQYVDGASYADFRVVGNAGSAPSNCYQGMTFEYNAWQGPRCSSTDRRLRGSPFLSTQPGQEDFHLAGLGAALAIVQAGSPDLALGTDMAGQQRPVQFPSDAGALEPDTSLLVLGRSIGSASLGAPLSSVEAVYGTPFRTRAVRIGDSGVSAELDIFHVPAGPLGVTTVDGTVVGLATTSPFYSTLHGLGAGTSFAEAKRLSDAAWIPCAGALRRSVGPVVVSFTSSSQKRKIMGVQMLSRLYLKTCPH